LLLSAVGDGGIMATEEEAVGSRCSAGTDGSVTEGVPTYVRGSWDSFTRDPPLRAATKAYQGPGF
jgi:hypothetical protein